MVRQGLQDAIKTYIEQTKLLVTLSSAFIIPPAVLFGLIPDINTSKLIWTEVLFIFSTVMGYIVLATITGSQAVEKYDPDRPETRIFSLLQFFSYIAGLILFVILIGSIPTKPKINDRSTTIYINEGIKNLKIDSLEDRTIMILNSSDTLVVIKK